MAAFPNDLSSQTTLARKSFVRANRAVDGTLRYIDHGAAPWYQLDGVVEALTASERDTLMAFFNTNATSEIDFDINGTTYRGRLTPETDITWETQGGSLYLIRFAAWVRDL